MEQAPFNNSAEHDNDEDDSSDAASKKRRRFAGLFTRQEEQPAEQLTESEPQSLWQRFINRLQPATPEQPDNLTDLSAEPESYPDESADFELPAEPDETAELLPVGELADDEPPAVLSALAEARLEVLDSEPEEDPAVQRTVADFLQEVAVTGNLDEAEARVVPEVAALQETLQSPPAAAMPEMPSERLVPEPGREVFTPAIEPQPRAVQPAVRPAPAEKVVIKDREHDYISPAVAGTVAGYLLGRRRGKLKTQKKLETSQKRLEKRVHNLEEQLQARETHIRRVVTERVRPAPLQVQERPRLRPEQFIRPSAPEAHHLHGTKAPERIGKVVVQGPRFEAIRRVDQPPAAKETAPRSAAKEVAAQVETLNRAELLTLAGSIYIDGANLRNVYETHLIGERGLRRLAAEHLRGGDVKRALQREITEHQIDFERDPQLRDRAFSATGGRSAATTPPTAPPSDTLGKLLEKAGAGMDDRVRSEAALLRARAAHEAREAARHSREQRMVDSAIAAIILALLAIIAALIITR